MALFFPRFRRAFYFWIFILPFLASTPTLVFPEIMRSFAADFRRDYEANHRIETSTGKIIYESASKKLCIEVISPVHQLIILQGSTTLIYYPEKGQAFKISSNVNSVLPFFEVVLGCLRDDFGLEQQGYTLNHYERKGDILISKWTPPKKLSGFIGEATLEYNKNQVNRIQYKSLRGELLSEATFKQYFANKGLFFPLEVTISYKSPLESRVEKVIFDRPQFDAEISDEFKKFGIPASVKVKDIVWK